MNKAWKTKTCETCENRVGDDCRINPPSGRYSEYPQVIKEDKPIDRKFRNWYMPACSKYEEVSE